HACRLFWADLTICPIAVSAFLAASSAPLAVPSTALVACAIGDLTPSTSARSITTMLLSAKGHHPSRHAGRTTIRLTLDSRARVRDNHSNTPPTTENTMRPIAATLLTAAAAIALTACSGADAQPRSEEHTSELQSRFDLVCRLLL